VAAVADTTHAAMSRTCTGANSCPACCASSSHASSDSDSASASAASASASEQRAGRCDQQCRYGGYCKKLGYPRHDDLPFVFKSASKAQPTPTMFLHFVQNRAHPMMFHAKRRAEPRWQNPDSPAFLAFNHGRRKRCWTADQG